MTTQEVIYKMIHGPAYRAARELSCIRGGTCFSDSPQGDRALVRRKIPHYFRKYYSLINGPFGDRGEVSNPFSTAKECT
jgi:hypothetical protein